jgi:hypothetical protein
VKNGKTTFPSQIASAGIFFALSLFAWHAVLILRHALPPLLSDIQTWDVAGFVLSEHFRGIPETMHALKHYPVPNSTIEVLPALLCLFLPAVDAARILLVVYLAIAFFAVLSMMRATKASPTLWWIVPSACFLGINFWYGQIGFLLGIALLLFFVAALVRRETSSQSEWVLGALLILLFLTHMVPFTFALLVLLFFTLQTARYRLLWQAAPSLLLTVWYVIGRFSSGDVDSSAAPTETGFHYGPAFWAFKANTFVKSFGFVNPSTADLKYSAAHAVLGSGVFLGTFAINLVMCGALFVFLLRRSTDVAQTRPYLWLAFLVTIPCYLIAPPSFLGIVDPGARILHTAVFPLILATPAWKRNPLSLSIMALCSVILASAGALLFARLPWTADVPHPAHPFPTAVERLARVPYAQYADQVKLLQNGDSRLPIWETSVLRDRKEQ